jgi:hypothetical protein
MLLVFFARMVDDLVASVVASAADRGKALIGQAELEAPRPRVELVPARPDANTRWVDGNWQWSGRDWTWQGGHWEQPRASRLAQKRAARALEATASSRRPNPKALTASGVAH